MTNFGYPEIERAARRARNREVARLVRVTGSAIARLGKRLVSGFGSRRVRHA